MLLRVEELRRPSTADGDDAGVVARRVRALHLVVDVLGLDEGVVGGESGRMEAITQHEYRHHRVREAARVIVQERDERLQDVDEAPHPNLICL